MSVADRIAIISPAEGLMVYQSEAPANFYIYKGGAWQIVAVAGGSNGQVQYNNNGTLGGAANATISNGFLNIGALTGIAVAPAAGVNVFSKLRAGKNMLSQVEPSGITSSFQPFFGQKRIAWWSADGNGTTVSTNGIFNIVTGTATARTVSTSSLLAFARRLGFLSGTNPNSSAGTRHNALQFFIGNQPGTGGFLYIARFAISSTLNLPEQRGFIGFTGSTAALPGADPSTNGNILGFGFDALDGSWKFMHNDATGTAVKEGTSGSFPVGNPPGNLYEIRIYCAPNSSTVYYSIEISGSGTYFEGSTNSELPLNTLLAPQIWINNGPTTTAVPAAIDVLFQYLETEY